MGMRLSAGEPNKLKWIDYSRRMDGVAVGSLFCLPAVLQSGWKNLSSALEAKASFQGFPHYRSAPGFDPELRFLSVH